MFDVIFEGVEMSAYAEMTPGLRYVYSKVGDCPVFKTNIQNQISVEIGDQQCQVLNQMTNEQIRTESGVIKIVQRKHHFVNVGR